MSSLVDTCTTLGKYVVPGANATSPLLKDLGGLYTDLGCDAILHPPSRIGQAASAARQVVQNVSSTAKEVVVNATTSAWESVSSTISEYGSAARDVVSEYGLAAKAAVVEYASPYVTPAVEAVTDAAKDLLQPTVQICDRAITEATAFGTTVVTNFKENCTTVPFREFAEKSENLASTLLSGAASYAWNSPGKTAAAVGVAVVGTVVAYKVTKFAAKKTLQLGGWLLNKALRRA